jgi:putative serine protease PepD
MTDLQPPVDSPVPTTSPSHRRVWLIVTAGVVIAAMAGVGSWLGVRDNDSNPTGAPAGPGSCPAVTVANNVLPTIVTISVQSGTTGGTGSGEIIRNDGYILTNNHVIAAAATRGTIQVLYSSGESVPATLVGRDPRSDLAVIKVTSSTSLPVIGIGNSSTLVVGQPVVALGAPLGLSGSVTSGIVSALGRDIPVPGDNGDTAVLAGAIQTDASINPGNSGGALVDCSGDLVGVNSAIATVPNETGQAGGGSVGIGFAIPVDRAIPIANEIIATGTVSYPYVGISVTPVPEAVAKKFDVTDGVYVQSVVAGGPAAQAGLRAGDVITEINGQSVTSSDTIVDITFNKKPGDVVTVNYLRNGQPGTASITLGTQP